MKGGDLYSILEQVVEGLAHVVGGGDAPGRGLLLDSYANRIELAFVARVLFGNTFGDVLSTFEPLRGIEVGALLAGVKFEPTLCALAQRFSDHRQDRATLGATRDGVCSGHLDGTRPEGVLARSGLVVRRALLIAAAVLISLLAVFPI